MGETKYLDALRDLLKALSEDDAIAIDAAAQWFIDNSGQEPITKLEMDYARRLCEQVSYLA